MDSACPNAAECNANALVVALIVPEKKGKIAKASNYIVLDSKIYMHTIKIWDPEALGRKQGGAPCKNYREIECLYSRHSVESLSEINGKKIKLWKLVYSSDDDEADEFIPIFYK